MPKSDNTTPPGKPIEPKYPPHKTLPPKPEQGGKGGGKK